MYKKLIVLFLLILFIAGCQSQNSSFEETIDKNSKNEESIQLPNESMDSDSIKLVKAEQPLESNDFIYYIDESNCIARIKKDGTNMQRLTGYNSKKIGLFFINNNTLYYVLHSKLFHPRKVKLF